jgi:hypothetical protein
MRVKKIDKNQNQIVNDLRDMGFSVELDKDDILVGKNGITDWIEIKEKSPFGKKGKLTKGFIKDSQYKILWNYTGQYNICWKVEQILNNYKPDIDFVVREYQNIFGITPAMFRENYKDWLTESELNRLRREEIINDGVKTCPFEEFMKDL